MHGGKGPRGAISWSCQRDGTFHEIAIEAPKYLVNSTSLTTHFSKRQAQTYARSRYHKFVFHCVLHSKGKRQTLETRFWRSFREDPRSPRVTRMPRGARIGVWRALGVLAPAAPAITGIPLAISARGALSSLVAFSAALKRLLSVRAHESPFLCRK